MGRKSNKELEQQQEFIDNSTNLDKLKQLVQYFEDDIRELYETSANPVEKSNCFEYLKKAEVMNERLKIRLKLI